MTSLAWATQQELNKVNERLHSAEDCLRRIREQPAQNASAGTYQIGFDVALGKCKAIAQEHFDEFPEAL